MVFATLPQKPHQQKRTKNYNLVHENHTKIEVFKLLTKNPPRNKRHTPVVVVVVAALVVLGLGLVVMLHVVPGRASRQIG